jgi:hypothetical protein
MQSGSGAGLPAPVFAVHLPEGATAEELLAALQLGSGEPAALVAQLRAHISDPGVVARLCMLLSAAPVADATADDAVAALAAAMHAHRSHAGVQHGGCVALAKLAAGSAGARVKAAAAAAGAINILIDALRAHAADAHVQQFGCAALGNLCEGTPINAQKACAKGAFGVVSASMRATPADVDLQTSACAAISHMIGQSPAMQLKAVAAGALGAVVAAMIAHPGDALLQRAACWAIQALVMQNADAAFKAAAAGVLPALVATLRTHAAAHADVAADACSVLNSLVALKAPDSITDIRRAAVDAGAIETLTAVLRSWRSDVKVQWHGWWAVASIYDDEEIAFTNRRAKKAATAAIDAAVGALTAHPANEGVQQNGCYALWCMTNTDADKMQAGRCGAVRAVVAALRAHPNHAFVQYHACMVLHSICEGMRANAAEARAAGAFAAVVVALRKHTRAVGDADVLPNACRALASMAAGVPDNQAQAAADGALQAVMGAMKAQGASERLQRYGFQALLSIVVGSADNERLAREIGVVGLSLDAVGASLAHHVGAPAAGGVPAIVQMRHINEDALDLLEALLRSPDTADWAVRANALETLQAGLNPNVTSTARVTTAFRRIAAHLQAAAARHDGAACTHADCKRCAPARARGALCALPGCGACKRAEDATKKLLRCGACRTATYCSAAHQADDWERHKPECRALAAARSRSAAT